MSISTKGRYGLRAMIDMAVHADESPVSVRSIAERQKISESYLEQVFATLRKGGLVRAVRGAGGGYTLALPPEKITAGRILKLLEGSLSPVFCAGSAECPDSTQCGNEKQCPVYPFWSELNKRIDEYIESVTLKELSLKNNA